MYGQQFKYRAMQKFWQKMQLHLVNNFVPSNPWTRRPILIRLVGLILAICGIMAIINVLIRLMFPKQHKDIFIYSSFYYDNSTSFLSSFNINSNYENGMNGYKQERVDMDTVVILFLAQHNENHDEYEFPYMRCTWQNPSQWATKGQGGGKSGASSSDLLMVPAQLTQLDYTGTCQLVLFVAWCHLPKRIDGLNNNNNNNNNNKNNNKQQRSKSGIKQEQQGHRPPKMPAFWLDMGTQIYADEAVAVKYLNQQMPPLLHKIQPKKGDSKPRKFVMCLSRLFAFENWKTLIAVMEAYKAFGVDLVVLHLYSAVMPVFKLLQEYEKEGKLALREVPTKETGIRFPHMSGMHFDPEYELEYSGQLAMAHDCFYEFRGSAQFIGLFDLDDLLLVSSPQVPTISQALTQAASRHPNAPYFYVNKVEGALLFDQKGEMNVQKLLAKSLLAKHQYNSEKIIVRPEKINGFWVHFSRDYVDNPKPVILPIDELVVLHLVKEINYTQRFEYPQNLLANWKSAGNQDEGNKFLESHTFKTLWKSLPTRPHYFAAIALCAKYMNAYPSMIHPPPCLSYSLCGPILKALKGTPPACMMTKSAYSNRQIGPANVYMVHVNQFNEFYLNEHGCFNDERGISHPVSDEDEL